MSSETFQSPPYEGGSAKSLFEAPGDQRQGGIVEGKYSGLYLRSAATMTSAANTRRIKDYRDVRLSSVALGLKRSAVDFVKSQLLSTI
jgi:hypothetical protein